MRVTIYDKNPGKGVDQWFLKTSWLLGCFLQKLFGLVDEYYGASSWDDALAWLLQRPGVLTSIQYWGHGSPGTVWLAGKMLPREHLLPLKAKTNAQSLLWWRTCSSFQGSAGYAFSAELANSLECVVAGHTRIIGLFQGGLHTRRPQEPARWDAAEGEPSSSWLPSWALWGPNTIWCFQTKIPDGW